MFRRLLLAAMIALLVPEAATAGRPYYEWTAEQTGGLAHVSWIVDAGDEGWGVTSVLVSREIGGHVYAYDYIDYWAPIEGGSWTGTRLLPPGTYDVRLRIGADNCGSCVSFSPPIKMITVPAPVAPGPVSSPLPPGPVPVPPEWDGDGVPDAIDNCVYDANSDQRDSDEDGIGDVCDEAPPEMPVPPEIRVGYFWLAPRPLQTGKRFAAFLRLVRSDTGQPPAGAGSVTCSAKVGGQRLRVAKSGFRAGTASCSWRVPAWADGMRVKGWVRSSYSGETFKRTFSVRV